MSKNIFQVYTDNPITTNQGTDLMYFGRSPYGLGDDTAMLFSSFAAQFGAPYTPAALTKVDDTNVTMTLGGTPATSLLQAVSITLGWTGQLSPARGGTGVNNGTSTLTLGGSLATIGAFASNFTMTGITNVTFPTSGTLATTAQIPSVTPSALTKVDDTNVTLTLGGTPATALLQAVSLTLGWTGTLSPTRGGTGVNNGTNTLTLGGTLTTSGAFNSVFTMTGATNVTFPTSGTLATTAQIPSVTPSALTKTDDTNVTLTLGGTPATALLQAVSLTLGWTGQLGLTRGGTNASLTASNGGIVYSSSSALAILAGTATARQMLQSGASTTPAWSTTTWPATSTINRILYSSANNTISEITTANSSVLVTDSSGVPSLSTSLPSGTTIGGLTIGIVTPWVAYTPTFTGYGTVTGVAFWSRRVGENLEVRGSFACGTPTAVEAQITLGFNGTNANVTSSNTLLDGVNVLGAFAISVASSSNMIVLVKKNVGYINYSLQDTSRSGLTPLNGNVLFSSGNTVSLYASIPIASWP